MAQTDTRAVSLVQSRVKSLLSATRRQLHIWTGIAALVLAIGTVGSILSSQALARGDNVESLVALQVTAADAASAFQLVIAHEQDFLIGAADFVANDPTASETRFNQWASTARMLDRFPEVISSGMVGIIPAGQLAAFAAHAVINPLGPLAPNGIFQVVPLGARPFYCLSKLSISRSFQKAPPAGLDFCSGRLGAVSMATRDSGSASYLLLTIGSTQLLGVVYPIYKAGVVPTSTQARRAAFLGWIDMIVQPKVILRSLTHGYSSSAFVLRYKTPQSSSKLAIGAKPQNTSQITINLHNGWSVQTFGFVSPRGVFRDLDALVLLLGGIILSILLAGVIDLLGSGRARAMDLVRKRTEELQYQAHHDGLTGLPNRVLIYDRAEQMLARARRNGIEVAALFLDIDDFKIINDTLGHTTGDQLLVVVASRLVATMREEDTVGRLGGDEFVILAEGSSLDNGIEVVAERILDAFRIPFAVLGSDTTLSISVSIGIAIGDRKSPEELLRDADIALYQAKARGKGNAVTLNGGL